MSENPLAINSYNSNHLSYAEMRPSYEDPIVDALVRDLAITARSSVLELAAGTGKFTLKLIDRGFSKIVVVEPSKGMLESFTHSFPNIEAHLGSSYDIPLPDDSVDSIVIAQAFHWFSDEKSLKEMRRVLKDDGKVGLIWNFDYSTEGQSVSHGVEVEYIGAEAGEGESPSDVTKRIFSQHPWNEKVSEYVCSFGKNVPLYRHGTWREILEDNEYFKPIKKEIFSFTKVYERYDNVFKYWETHSFITDLSENKRKEVQATVEQYLETTVRESDKSSHDGKVYLERYRGSNALVLEPKSFD